MRLKNGEQCVLNYMKVFSLFSVCWAAVKRFDQVYKQGWKFCRFFFVCLFEFYPRITQIYHSNSIKNLKRINQPMNLQQNYHSNQYVYLKFIYFSKTVRQVLDQNIVYGMQIEPDMRQYAILSHFWQPNLRKDLLIFQQNQTQPDFQKQKRQFFPTAIMMLQQIRQAIITENSNNSNQIYKENCLELKIFGEYRMQQPNYIQSTSAPTNNQHRRQIGNDAVWTLSSAKTGNGVQQLRDDNTTTFWQSDGSQPHLINIQFMKKTRIQELSLYFDFKSDESYTPNKLSIRAGNSLQDLKEVQYLQLKQPTGWYTVPLKAKLLNSTQKNYITTINLQICILQNQHSGKDTHIRQIKIFGPKDKINQGLGFPDFKAPEITQFYSIR